MTRRGDDRLTGPAAPPGPGTRRPPADGETLTEAVNALRGGDRSVPAHAEAVCNRIDEADRTLRVFVPEPGRRERIRTAAERITRTWPEPAAGPPLYGVAVGVKDIVRVDAATRAGSRLPPELFEGPQASVVDRLVKAGAFLAGKTVTAEFAGPAPGPTRNPHRPRHTPGGWSSGSAAAVAAGVELLAIGTQTIGSVIRPAAYCGVTGFRPTHGRIPVDGVVPNAPTYDTVGLFTHDVRGAALAAGQLCDDWSADPGPGGLPVLGVPWSHAGMPALGLPVRRPGRGLPLGLQCVARPGADERLLLWGAVLERALATLR
ncbi:amidase family protein [Streptomyces meridianus]|uniref:Amidase n=1 Tax=Streptomyces meridianus TaxID=2938945 RepID=A0ABT0XBR8_9ACTN|nr:amidase [Streptomyces meridianus]MCM2579970.1 amidase [Streptomyces meridianus]